MRCYGSVRTSKGSLNAGFSAYRGASREICEIQLVNTYLCLTSRAATKVPVVFRKERPTIAVAVAVNIHELRLFSENIETLLTRYERFSKYNFHGWRNV